LSSARGFYTSHSLVTDPGEHLELFRTLGREVPMVRDTVQGLLLHVFWAERYGIKLTEERSKEVQLRAVQRQVKRILELDASPLSSARPLERRLVGNCRDFTVLTTSMLRSHGIPARARCGFGTYFIPGRFEDHWVTEYWKADEGRWVMIDTQLDALQRSRLGIDFDPLDMPKGKFLSGGEAWLMCREKGVSPDLFGIHDLKGWCFIRGDLIRDLLALNKVEILPWDGWGLMARSDSEALTTRVRHVDYLAELTLDPEKNFAKLRRAYEKDPTLRASLEWRP